MNIVNFLKEQLDKFKFLKWTKSEKENLFRILLEIYNSDGIFTEDEKKDFKKRSFGLGIDEEKIKLINFEKAITELKNDITKMEVVYYWIASSLFSDEDYEKAERDFIDKIIAKYNLDGKKLKTIIKKIRDGKIVEEISKWSSEI